MPKPRQKARRRRAPLSHQSGDQLPFTSRLTARPPAPRRTHSRFSGSLPQTLQADRHPAAHPPASATVAGRLLRPHLIERLDDRTSLERGRRQAVVEDPRQVHTRPAGRTGFVGRARTPAPGPCTRASPSPRSASTNFAASRGGSGLPASCWQGWPPRRTPGRSKDARPPRRLVDLHDIRMLQPAPPPPPRCGSAPATRPGMSAASTSSMPRCASGSDGEPCRRPHAAAAEDALDLVSRTETEDGHSPATDAFRLRVLARHIGGRFYVAGRRSWREVGGKRPGPASARPLGTMIVVRRGSLALVALMHPSVIRSDTPRTHGLPASCRSTFTTETSLSCHTSQSNGLRRGSSMGSNATRKPFFGLTLHGTGFLRSWLFFPAWRLCGCAPYFFSGWGFACSRTVRMKAPAPPLNEVAWMRKVPACSARRRCGR